MNEKFKKIQTLLADELISFTNKPLAESNYKDFEGLPTSSLTLSDVEVEEDYIYLNLKYNWKYFERKVKKGNAVAGWNVKNDKNTYYTIPIEIEFGEYNTIWIFAYTTNYFDGDIYCKLQIRDDEIVSEGVKSEVQKSKTIEELISKVINLIEIKIKNIYNDNYVELNGDDEIELD